MYLSSNFPPYFLLSYFCWVGLSCSLEISFSVAHARTTLYISVLLSAFRPLCPSVCALSPVGLQTWTQSCTRVELFFIRNSWTCSIGGFDCFTKLWSIVRNIHFNRAPHSLLLSWWSCPMAWSLSFPESALLLWPCDSPNCWNSLGACPRVSPPTPIPEFPGIARSSPCLLCFSVLIVLEKCLHSLT